MKEPASNEVECDVVVLGSGAGGLSAALSARLAGLNVHVLEKEGYFGGTTARSGGVLWIPGNPVNARQGVIDSAEKARTYIQDQAGDFFDEARVAAFLKHGPEMVDYFEAKSSVRFVQNAAFPDYHPFAPGAVEGGRSIVAAPIRGTELGAAFSLLRPPLKEITFVGMMFNASAEVQHFFRATTSLSSFFYVIRRLLAHGAEMLRYGRAVRLTNGNALVARLAKSCLESGVKIHVGEAAVALLREGGRVTGVVADTPDGPRRYLARNGVVLACGGFPHDVERKSRLFPHAPNGTEHLSPAPQGNTGDGIRLGHEAGAITVDDIPNAAAWIPVSEVPYRDGTKGRFPHLIDRYKPGIIAVLKNGHRFVNEADSYHDVGQAMIRECTAMGQPVEAWLICDAKALRKYGMGFVKPFPVPHLHHLRSGYLLRGRTLRELARHTGIDADGLADTVARFNHAAAGGEDPDFGRGRSAYNRFLGDADHEPNPCLAPLEMGPFFAIRIVVGDLGTFAGLKTDEHARVLAEDGQPIPGLNAVGNDMASIMGGNYPGGGITLGPAMTFGYIAGQTLAGKSLL
ncbi:FAD-dependent oxidoreductase [Aquamicrobium defluvii]|uniref:3-oxosteroid 1-dehydrogenase n=1 Tax=Aquamicrobium defluvii TaxID=69279 RepID=A0A011UBX5_9HYPH|nr:FAD-dependent oxidoreductase [Aquamicrobium defluvii]EXL03616.1 3-oxosteroid 1-dehydrogenase [Aquamicrobium defluvii]EZQ15273.1 3-oxosteroid 1-dehydrogenase [Halopseudomonas bauzanensis]TDR32098.1 succinate dehydrogenase/fumarate reductase flavoprotein subunit [Aquamicrobium defluvii]